MKILSLIFLIFFSSCNKHLPQKHKSPEYVSMADQITVEVAKKLEKEKQLYLIGTGGGMMHHVRMASMSFEYHQEVTINEGRALLLACIDEYLASFNAHEQIRPHLANFPFEPKNVEIVIFIKNLDKSEASENKLAVISASEEIFKYKINNPKTDRLKTIHRETYDEAAIRLAGREPEPPKPTAVDYLASVTESILGKNDPSIEFISEASAIIFNQIPGTGPYRVETRRLNQANPDRYLPAFEQQMVLNSLDGLVPFGIQMPPKGYLPGERVVWRISSSSGEVLKEVVHCPVPLKIQQPSGLLLMEAALISIRPTVYMLYFPDRKEPIDFTFSNGVTESTGTIPAGEFETTTFEPGIEKREGGMSQIELRVDGASYSLELPWGEKLIPRKRL